MSTETDKIERDIEQSRTRLNDTIEQLGGKLSPGQMLDEALGVAKGQAGELVGNLGRHVKENPIPLLLIGAGIGMLAMNMRKDSGASDAASAPTPSLSHDEWRTEGRYRKLESARTSTARLPGESEADYMHRLHEAEAGALDLKQQAGEAVEAFKERVKAAGHSLHETASGIRAKMDAGMHKAADMASSMAKGAAHGVKDAAHTVKAGVGEAKHKAQALYDEYPLAAGAIGLAVGAIIGAMAPLSSMERDKLAGVADAAAKAGADAAEKGAQMVQKTADKAAAALH